MTLTSLPGVRVLATAVTGSLLALALSGCATTLPAGEAASLAANTYSPVMTPQTDLNSELQSLPPPAKRVQVAVYDFPDLTGQYKEQDNFQSLSRAVTQGGSSMLIKALQDAGHGYWFTVFDRAALNDLLKERQIVTEMRKVYRGEETIDPAVLPPLDYASIVLEGGIVGYDTNTLTGGAGANFLGIGGNTKWTQDTITVTLRAVSAKTSEVLATVTVNKVIASVALDGNVFRYVQMDKLLQAEAGITHNEPKQIAVQAAIDKAVMALIMEGSRLHIWSFKDKDAGATLVANYVGEKYGKDVADAAVPPALPATRNAAAVVKTTPLARPKTPPAAPPTTGAPDANLPPAQGNNGEVLN